MDNKQVTKEELIALCRYYKGEKENPFVWEENPDAHHFWNDEKAFVEGYRGGAWSNMSPIQAMIYHFMDLFGHWADFYEGSYRVFFNKYYNIRQ